MRQSALRFSVFFVLALLLGGCSTYRVLVSQGNVVKADRLEQLKEGMTPEQVEYLLGTPLLRSPVAENRWDYIFRAERGGQVIQERRVTVFFEQGVVSRIEDTQPPQPTPPPVAEPPVTEPPAGTDDGVEAE